MSPNSCLQNLMFAHNRSIIYILFSSIGYLAADGTPRGECTSAPGIEFYTTTSTATADNTKCIILIPDVWGWNSGRIRNIADHFANELNCLVVIPKIQPPLDGGTDGDALPPDFDMSARGGDFKDWASGESMNWAAVQPRLQALHDHLVNTQGVTKIGVMGFCWGYWCTAHMLGVASLAKHVVCSVAAHPSVTLEERFFGGDNIALMDAVNVPTLLMPAKNDPDVYREGGELFLALQSNGNSDCVTHSYPDVVHGFVNRGDCTDELVKASVKASVEDATEWFQRFM